MNKNRVLTPRRGVGLICVLVCLSVSTAIAMSMLLTTLQTRRNDVLLRQMRQTEFLLDAGVQRATRQLNRSTDYDGEVWRPASLLTGEHNAQANIEVSGHDSSRRVVVIARMQLGSAHSMTTQRSHTFEYNFPTQPSIRE